MRWLGQGPGFGRGDGCGAVEQRLAAQPLGDVAGFADGRRGGFGVSEALQVLGVVEQAMGEVVGGAVLAQAGDRRGEGRGGGRVAWPAVRRARARSRSARSIGARCPGW